MKNIIFSTVKIEIGIGNNNVNGLNRAELEDVKIIFFA